MKKIAVLLSIIFCMALLPLQSVIAAETANVSNEEIIKEVAWSFQRQKGQILYDQYATRKHTVASPEDATAQHTLYLDCSGYVNACYYEAFGVHALRDGTYPTTTSFYQYVKSHKNAIDVAGFWTEADFAEDAEKEALEATIRQTLQVGDILGYRHGSYVDAQDGSGKNAGHVYIYVGNGTFLHRSGSGCDSFHDNSSNPAKSYDGKDDPGISSISTMSIDTIFTPGQTRYLFKEGSDAVRSIFILRPLARGLTPTEESIARMTVAGLAMEKTSSVHENNSVTTGDTITYTITLENTTTSAISNVTLTDVIPAGTKFVSGNVTANGSLLTWTGSVAKSATVTLTYTVEVTSTIPGQLIKSDNTEVNGVGLGNITHTVSTFKAQNVAGFTATAIAYAEEEKTFTSNVEMARTLYSEALGVNLATYESVDKMLDDLISTYNKTCRTDTELSKMIVPNLFGGVNIRSGHHSLPDNERTRLLTKEQLAVGDIIVADWDNGNDLYVYAGGTTLLSLENGKATALTIGEDIYGSDADNILVSIYGYDRFAVLRPSMANTDKAVFAIVSDTTVIRGKTLTLATEGGGAGAVSFTVTNGTGEATLEGNVLTAIKVGTVTVTATKGDKTTAPVTITIEDLPSLPDTVIGGYEKINGLEEGITYLISPIIMKSAAVDGTTVTSSSLLPAMAADSWTEITTSNNSGLVGLYKIKAVDASGEELTHTKTIYVKGKIADRENIGSTSFDGTQFNMVENKYGSSWYAGRFSMGSIASASYISGSTTEINILIVAEDHSFRSRVVTQDEERYSGERERYNSIHLDNFINSTNNPVNYINSQSDKAAAKALYAEAAEHYSLNYAMAAREVVPANSFSSMTYKTRHDGSVNMGSTMTKVRFYVYNVEDDTFCAFDAYDDVLTSSAITTFSTHEIFASDAKLVTYDPAIEGDGQTVAYLDKNIRYSETVTLANLGDGNYIVGFEIHPVAMTDTNAEATADWSVSGKAVNRFPTRFLQDKYILNTPAADAPRFEFDPETKTVSNLDMTKKYYVVPLEMNDSGTGMQAVGEKHDIAVVDGKADLSSVLTTAGVYGIASYANDYEGESKFAVVYVSGTDAEKQKLTINEADANNYPYRYSNTTPLTDWTPGRWTYYTTKVNKWLTAPRSYAIGFQNKKWEVTLSDGTVFNMTTAQTTYATLPTAKTEQATSLQEQIKEGVALLSYKYELLPQEILPAKDFINFKYGVRLDNSSIDFGSDWSSKLVIYSLQPDGEIKKYEKANAGQTISSFNSYNCSADDFTGLSDDNGYIVGIEIFPCIANDATAILYNGKSQNTNFSIRVYFDDYEFTPTPDAPTAAMVEGDVLTVSNPDANYSYEYKAEGGQWRALASNSVTIDKAGTKYYVRIAKGATNNASAASTPVTSHTFVATGTSLVLGGEIGIKTYFDVEDDATLGGITCYAKGTDTEVDFEIDEEDNAIIIYVPAKERTTDFEYRYTYNDDTVTRYTVSVEKYIGIAENEFANNENALTLVNAIDSYTTQADIYFSNKAAVNYIGVNSLTNANDIPESSYENSDSGLDYRGAALILEGKTAIRHYFKLAEGTGYTAWLGNTQLDIEEDGGNGVYYVDVADIGAKDIGTAYTVTIKKGETATTTITYSVLNYLNNKNVKDKIGNLARAMYDYYKAAVAFDENSGK